MASPQQRPPSERTDDATPSNTPPLSATDSLHVRRHAAVKSLARNISRDSLHEGSECSSMGLPGFDEDEDWEELTGEEILQALESQGILQDDQRVSESVAYLKSKLHEPLTAQQFSDLAKKDSVLDRALTKNLVVTEFRLLCEKMEQIFEDVRDIKDPDGYCGDVADYIPQLARVPARKYGMALCSIEGQRWSVGDAAEPFCIQSCSKAITYAIALQLNGIDKTHTHVGREPSGKGFNARVLDHKNRPHNPLINSGAIMTCSLVAADKTIDQRFDDVMDYWKRLAGGVTPGFNNSVYLSERGSADRNFCLGFMMKEVGGFPGGKEFTRTELEKTLEFYFMCCSIELHCQALSVVAATLANGGVCPLTNERVFSPATVRNTLSLMYTCGMYDYSGQFAFEIGFPCKSGVGGGLLIVIPGKLGICTWSPRLDKLGNSYRGLRLCREMGTTFPFHSNISNNSEAASHMIHVFNQLESRNLDSTSIMFAAAEGDLAECQRGVACGLDPDFPDYDKRSAIHVAAANGQDSVVRFLILQGVDTTSKDRLGHTPLDDAIRAGHVTTQQIIEQELPLDFDYLDRGNPIDNAYRSLHTDTNNVTYQRLIDVISECGILIDDPRIARVIPARELLRAASKPISRDSFTEMCTHAPILLQAISGQLCIADFQMLSDEITDVFNEAKDQADSMPPEERGDVPQHHDFLGNVDPELCGVAICSCDGQQFSIGDSEYQFTAHALGRPLLYSIACDLQGCKFVHEYVGIEPSGDGYKSLSLNGKHKPHNALINCGAMVTASMVKPEETLARRFQHVHDKWIGAAGSSSRAVGFSNPCFLVEQEVSDRNQALAYMLKEEGVFPQQHQNKARMSSQSSAGEGPQNYKKYAAFEQEELEQVLQLYSMLESITIDAEKMAAIAATLANAGVCPLTDERVFSEQVTRDCLSVMSATGAFNYSGELAFSMGFPAMFSISGGTMIVIPGVMGICVYSPRVNKDDLSVFGLKFAEVFAQRVQCHRFGSLPGLDDQLQLYDPSVKKSSMNNHNVARMLDAAANGDRKLMKQMLIMGVSPRSTDYDGRTALHLAASEGQLGLIKYMTQLQRAQSSTQDWGVDINARDRWNCTPLGDAEREGHTEVAKLLKRFGAVL